MKTQYRIPKSLPETVAIVGSRNFSELQKVRDLVAALPDTTTVVSGGASGVDCTAEAAAKAQGLEVKSFPVLRRDWQQYGKRAGILRNEKLLDFVQEQGGYVFIFVMLDEYGQWTPGSKHVIETCEKRGIPHRVFQEETERYDF